MSSIETKIPNQSIPESEEIIREHEGAGSVDEIVAMPESFATESGAGNPFELEEPDLVTEAGREEIGSMEALETLSEKQKIWVRAIGFVALTSAVAWRGAKEGINKITSKKSSETEPTHNELWMTDRKKDIDNIPAWPKNQSPNTRQFVDAAVDAKKAGDWMTYQKELLRFVDAADHTLENGTLSKKALDQRVVRADKRLDKVEPDRIESQTPPELQREREWLNPKNVLDLRNAIDEEFAKSDDKSASAKQELIKRLTEEYFGAYYKDLESGRAVPMGIQNKVAGMLNMPKHDLEALSNPKKKQFDSKNITPAYKHKEAYNPYARSARMTSPISAEELAQIHDESDKDEELAKAA